MFQKVNLDKVFYSLKAVIIKLYSTPHIGSSNFPLLLQLLILALVRLYSHQIHWMGIG